MKVTVDSKTLADAVAWTARALSQRPSVPVLGGILLVADGDQLTFSAFDYETSTRCTVEAREVAEPGKVLLPGRVLAEVTKSLPNEPVEMSLSGSEVTLTCGGAKFDLLTMPADDYPKLPDPPAEVGTVDAAMLRDAVNQVHPATSRDDSLPMLTGIRLDTDAGHLTLAATDRYRIAARHLTWQPTIPGAQHGVLVPGRVLHDVARGLAGDVVTIGLAEGIVRFECGGRTTTVRLLDDQFVGYRKLLDIEPAHHAEVDLPPFLAAVKRVAVMAEKSSPIRLAFGDDELTLRAGGGDTGRGTETIACEVDGDPIDIAFQPQYLVDALTAVAVSGDRVRIGMTTPAQPALFTPAGVHNPGFRILVMSLRLS